VDVASGGSGSVTVTLDLPKEVAAEAEADKVGFVTGDLRLAGWVVKGPVPGPGGGVALSAAHSFSSLTEASRLVADIAGTGAAAARPFRLLVSEARGALADRYRASGAIDLRCGLACFDDPRLARSVGYPLGLPPQALHALLGVAGAKVASFRFVLQLPGRLLAGSAASEVTVKAVGRRSGRPGATLEWSASLGSETTIGAATRVVDLPLLRDLVTAVSAGALVVLATAASLLVRRKRLRGLAPLRRARARR
jgi:hypothetical protein